MNVYGFMTYHHLIIILLVYPNDSILTNIFTNIYVKYTSSLYPETKTIQCTFYSTPHKFGHSPVIKILH